STPLQSLGYIPLAFPGHAPAHLLWYKGQPRTHHLHMVPQGSYEHRRHIAFRDYLRTHADTAHAYAVLKIRLAQRYATDREEYSRAKTDFVQAIEPLVLQESSQKADEARAAGDRA